LANCCFWAPRDAKSDITSAKNLVSGRKGFDEMKKVATVAVVAFAVTLAVIIGKRMSTDAMAVVIGVACGVMASIPTSLLILAVSGRRGEREVPRQPNYPPVVIVNPGNNQPQPRYLQPPLQAPQFQGQERQFKVIGEEDVVLDGGRYF
jgi:hypothetical protein